MYECMCVTATEKNKKIFFFGILVFVSEQGKLEKSKKRKCKCNEQPTQSPEK